MVKFIEELIIHFGGKCSRAKVAQLILDQIKCRGADRQLYFFVFLEQNSPKEFSLEDFTTQAIDCLTGIIEGGE